MLSDQPLIGALGQVCNTPIPQDGDAQMMVLPNVISAFPYRYPVVFDPGVQLQRESTINLGGSAQVIGAGSNSAALLSLSKGVWEISAQASCYCTGAAVAGQTAFSIVVMDSTSTQIGTLRFLDITQITIVQQIAIDRMIIASRISFMIQVAVFGGAGATVNARGSAQAHRLL